MKVTERLSPNSEQLKSFVVIAECGNLSHAAERLCRTQSAISVQLRKLEESLNVSLFERQARGMALNANGKKLLPVAQRALAEMRQAGALFEEPLQGRIRVGIPDDFDDNILERALAGFSRNHPGVEIITHSGCTSGFRGDLEQGVLDVAVCSGPDVPSGTILSCEPTIWVAAKGLALAADDDVPLAVLDRQCWWRDIPTQALEQHGRAWKVVFQSSSFPSLKAAIRAGLAVGVVTRTSLEGWMRVLTEQDGFPPLPSAYRTILMGRDSPPDLSSAMAGALTEACLEI